MTGRAIGLDDIEDLALGAVVLGTGGGGDPYVAKIMLAEAIEKYGPVPLVDAADLDPDGLLLPVAMVGAPTVIVEKFPNGNEAHTVLRALEEHRGDKGVAVMPIEVGGMNTLFPIAVAAELGLPCVDADSMRRAFPQIEMTLLTLDGISSSPMTLADVKGNYVYFDAQDNATGEKLVRACVAQMGMIAVMSAYPMTAAQCARHAVNGSVTFALEIGRRVNAIQQGKPGAYDEFLTFCEAQILFTGKVLDIERHTTAGWARGTVTLEHLDDRSRVMRVDIQNENLIAFEDGVPLATVPDLITLMDIETGVPMTTESLGFGQRLHVIGMPAHPRWITPDGLALAGPRAFGYDLDYVPLGGAR
ncbi:DUF917 domain-containing protein [Nakamurella lactea]|uniref:DUF917 domain-containing protein n=1 Tax=Nakamurella lactea TaxID=459515 RepID=UPI0003F52E84|nr:DUF917 domain-containing protein [Nakamurella lactea]